MFGCGELLDRANQKVGQAQVQVEIAQALLLKTSGREGLAVRGLGLTAMLLLGASAARGIRKMEAGFHN